MDESVPPDDGGDDRALENRRQYEILRRAIEDALLSVIGTVVLLAFAFSFFSVGAFIVIDGGTTPALAIGGAMMAVGALGAAILLDLFP
ncbi:hypothetical protein [Halostagnicola sp. A-GB9-2]|uniref:hypothetical protein n=1 Tax=Halostagnicola sp. A-GB9-2 TaxID=3048066 RepID=UPI0024C0A832|nr:hypothetical protein [Halostagnicola sp. A-GB9-2]MDJ1433914.1 hypothetical protein [Halostagnicola sp. A-GB9-2]